MIHKGSVDFAERIQITYLPTVFNGGWMIHGESVAFAERIQITFLPTVLLLKLWKQEKRKFGLIQSEKQVPVSQILWQIGVAHWGHYCLFYIGNTTFLFRPLQKAPMVSYRDRCGIDISKLLNGTSWRLFAPTWFFPQQCYFDYY